MHFLLAEWLITRILIRGLLVVLGALVRVLLRHAHGTFVMLSGELGRILSLRGEVATTRIARIYFSLRWLQVDVEGLIAISCLVWPLILRDRLSVRVPLPVVLPVQQLLMALGQQLSLQKLHIAMVKLFVRI